MFFSNQKRNSLWDNFEKINTHYSNNDYKYKIYLSVNNTSIQYSEILNNTVISKIEFNIYGEYHWRILQFCNKEVKSLEQIIEYFNVSDDVTKKCKLKESLAELNNEFLLYSNPEFSENITVINTDIVL
jgi:hypothetical protein